MSLLNFALVFEQTRVFLFFFYLKASKLGSVALLLFASPNWECADNYILQEINTFQKYVTEPQLHNTELSLKVKHLKLHSVSKLKV